MEDAGDLLTFNHPSVSATDLHLANGAILPGTTVAEGDDQSSSLSDIDDGPDEEDADDNVLPLGDVPAQDDSEAETERLENSPQKLAKHKNVVLSSALREPGRIPDRLMQHSMDEQLKDNEGSTSVQSIGHVDAVYRGINNGDSGLRARSISVLLAESCDDNKSVPLMPEIAGKKRKRTSPRIQEVYDESEKSEWVRKRSAPFKSESNANSLSRQNSLSDQDIEEHQKELEATGSDIDTEQANDDEKAVKATVQTFPSTKAKKGKTGKRKGKKIREGLSSGTAQSNTMAVDDGYSVDDGQVPNAENIEEEEETAMVEGDGEEVEAEVAARTEEECESHAHNCLPHSFYQPMHSLKDVADEYPIVVKKKTAMDSLTAIEKHFAAFRDKYVQGSR